MGSNPINLALRFLLEIAALIAIGKWAYNLTDGWVKYVFAICVPVICAAIWGVFAVADDPSRSGSAPIPVSGLIRLVIELCFFGFAAWALYELKYVKSSIVLSALVLIHYIISYDRIIWLLKQ